MNLSIAKQLVKPRKHLPLPLADYYGKIFKHYDLVNKLFTFGQDDAWRADAATECLKDGPALVLDVCCGTGDLAIKICSLAKKTVVVTGFDFSLPMLSEAEKKFTALGLSNTRIVRGDATQIPFGDKTFDCITIGFGIRNLVYKSPLAKVRLKEMARILKPGGKIVFLESGVPSSPIIKFFHALFLFLFLVPLGTILSGDWKSYWYLARSSAAFSILDEVSEILEERGLKVLVKKRYFFGAANLVIAR